MARESTVKAEDLSAFLEGIEAFKRAEMVRGGRSVKTEYVEVVKGPHGYMTDEFRARARDGAARRLSGRQRVWVVPGVVKETLYCSGKTNCLRCAIFCRPQPQDNVVFIYSCIK